MSERTDESEEIRFTPWDPKFIADPFPTYRRLLAGPPRIVQLRAPTVLIARYADAVLVLRDHQRFSSRFSPDSAGVNIFGAPAMVFEDPPAHSRLRRLVNQAFTPRRIREMEPRIRAIAQQLLDAVEAKGEFEVMNDFANALPNMVMAEILGIPPEDYRTFKSWADTVIDASQYVPSADSVPQAFFEALAAERAYFDELLVRRRREPGQDLISALIAAHDDRGALTGEELIGFFNLLLVAGNDTTVNLIGSGLLQLSRHPDQLELVRRQPTLISQAVEEILRYDGPVQQVSRITTCEVEVGGTTLPAGMDMWILIAAANRDPAQFPDPDKFDVLREPNDHIAFGEGIHFCLGAALARLEGAVAIRTVVERFPQLRLVDPGAELIYGKSFAPRGLAALPMRID